MPGANTRTLLWVLASREHGIRASTMNSSSHFDTTSERTCYGFLHGREYGVLGSTYVGAKSIPNTVLEYLVPRPSTWFRAGKRLLQLAGHTSFGSVDSRLRESQQFQCYV